MKKTIFSLILSILLFFLPVKGTLSLDNEDIIILKRAGISDETVQVMVREKTEETCAFTIQEILQLKNGGVSEETIRMIIEEGSFMKYEEPRVYGKDIQSIRFTTVEDIIKLKEAGLSDKVIQAIVVFGSRDIGDRERERAWEMLTNMGLIVDIRTK